MRSCVVAIAEKGTMESLPADTYLKFNVNALKDVRKEYNLDKPGEMDEAIDNLEQWIQKQAHFKQKEFSRQYLERAIITNKGSLEKAKSCMDKICTFRTLMPQYFDTCDVRELKLACDSTINVLLPQQNSDNYRVYLYKAIIKEFTSKHFFELYKYIVNKTEYVKSYDYSHGIIVFCDLTEINLLNACTKLNPLHLREIAMLYTEAYGMRIKGLHMLTQSKAIDTMVSLLKSILSSKISSRIVVHKTIDTVYQYVDKDILPEEYGGKEKSIYKLRDDFVDELTSKKNLSYLEKLSQAGTNEEKRQSLKFNEEYIGMPGSFRTLRVD